MWKKFRMEIVEVLIYDSLLDRNGCERVVLTFKSNNVDQFSSLRLPYITLFSKSIHISNGRTLIYIFSGLLRQFLDCRYGSEIYWGVTNVWYFSSSWMIGLDFRIYRVDNDKVWFGENLHFNFVVRSEILYLFSHETNILCSDYRNE